MKKLIWFMVLQGMFICKYDIYIYIVNQCIMNGFL